ncbi:adenine nucleotide alpha hydrolase [Campylobacterota bacterium]|nr:adenine nucleotide alpha hydrolase [Campylobacterota bacterium]
MHRKYKQLREHIGDLGSLLVAFSGGVDSSFLLKTATDVLGAKAMGITVITPYIAQYEVDDALRIASEIGAQHDTLSLPFSEAIRRNPENRCYVCKYGLFSELKQYAADRGFAFVAEGSNVDDTHEHRPGRVAIAELGITTPLLAAGLTKTEIRALSREQNLSTWNKPSYACLLTRFEHGHEVKADELAMVGAAEKLLIDNGYGAIRVRFAKRYARLEMPNADAVRLLSNPESARLVEQIRGLGFSFVTLDLQKSTP